MCFRVNDFWVFYRGNEIKGFKNFYVGCAWAVAVCR